MAFFYSQLFVKLPHPTGSYVGKTIIITGSNTGLGKEAAKHYARMGASRLILAVRNLDKGHSALQDIQASVTRTKSDIQVWPLDMANYASVQKFAARVNSELDRLDVCLLNAGVANAKYSVLEDNEAQITVNVVSTFLLAALVMPKMRETAAKYNTRPNLSITTSGAHAFSKFPQRKAPQGRIFATINDKETAEKNWNGQYPLSKMIEIFAVRTIGEKYPSNRFPVTVNCMDPGLCKSELSRDFPTLMFAILKFLLARSTEMGSRALLDAGSKGPNSHGQYLSDAKIAKPAPLVLSADGKVAQDRLWVELSEKLEAISPGCMNNFN